MLSLTALWVFAAWVTLREGVNLLGVSSLDSALAQPTDPLIAELQRERRLSMVQLARPNTATQSALAAQRQETDKARTEVMGLATGGSVDWFADDTLETRRDDMLERLRSLENSRRIVDARSGERDQVSGQYTDVISSIFEVYDALATLDDEAFARDTRLLLELNRTWELLSQEDSLLAGALATGRMSDAEMIEFTQLVGTRRHNLNAALNDVRESDGTVYADLTKNEKIVGIATLENQIMQGYRIGRPTRSGVQPAVTAEQWNAAAEPALAEMRTKIQGAGDRLVDRATPIAAGVILRLALAGGLGLLAVIASVVVSITTARALVRQLERLRAAAFELAEKRLPGVVERLGHGEKVDVATEAPPLRFGSDEIGEVGRAFNVVQETAIRTAVEQAELRRGIRDVLLSLARRTQTLVHRQLTMLDTMERRRDIETRELEELFRLDHLATRMRRNAENLIVLSGALPARGWRNPVPMVDVVRAAVGEVEDYTRVSVLPFGSMGLAGRAVGDVTHLLAELIENAVSFSPPDTVVQVGGHLVGNGFAIDIEDRGLGMTDEKLAEINGRIVDPPDFNLQSSVQLGLFVVSKLAERYGLQVMLKRSAYGGTTAVVVIPSELIVDQPEDRQPAPPRTAVKDAPTTPNGLEVRQPAGVGAAAAPVAGTGPALVAVPGVSGPKPASDAAVPAGAARPGDGAPVDETRSPGDDPRPASPADTGERPVTIEPEDLPPVPDISTTPSGLPVRVPQANLAEPLRTDEPAAAPQPDEDDDPGRSPEEIKRIMGSYQRGTRQGRSDAATTLGNTEGEEEQ
ncbi:nitrate- and nitrite sensing domain-containing protein [Actinomadura sp. WMMB 499]|uniref:sensor histidine kinase n=1 Tax=Actinomadura sp. WMMB 499 TaxID=1219491 RepID=UPI0020C7DF92|nr:nitrate- and nitrite sensing domain-containing protein [Actinomadura sp. WMMB 499]